MVQFILCLKEEVFLNKKIKGENRLTKQEQLAKMDEKEQED
jgi:hypothetical protein